MKEFLFAGAGGQGVLTCGLITSEIANHNKFNTTWSPSYGSAMRGGDANCTVKYGQVEIYNPSLESPDVLLAMNQSSFNKFINSVAVGAIVVTNKDMVVAKDVRPDIRLYEIPCVSMANQMGESNLANIIMLGVIMKLVGDFEQQNAIDGMNQMFTSKGKGKFNNINTEAFNFGYNCKEIK